MNSEKLLPLDTPAGSRKSLLIKTLALVGILSSAPAFANGFDYVLWNNSPRWQNSVMKWYYNPANQPTSMSTDAMLALIQADMAKWSAACGIRFEYQGTTSATPTANDGFNVIGWSNANGYDGYTQYWSRGGYFIDMDIRLDPNRLSASNAIDAIVNHELGHAVGLDHSDEAAAIMYANPYHSYEYQRTLRDDDIAGCRALYGDAPTTSHAFEIVASGTNSNLDLSAKITVSSADQGAYGSIYLAARLGSAWFFHNGSGWTPWNGGTIPVYFNGNLTSRTVTLASGLDGASLAGGQIIVGYGRSETEMLVAARYATIYTFSR